MKGIFCLLLASAGFFPLVAIPAWAQQEQPANPEALQTEIDWEKDFQAARQSAATEKKLVLQFLMLGDLTDPKC